MHFQKRVYVYMYFQQITFYILQFKGGGRLGGER